MGILYFVLSLSILILLHEMGHFLAARAFKTRVEKFYLFFDFLFPIPTLLNFALFKKKIGDTEYGIGWFPLGGYVKIAGMMDESMDEDAMKLPPQPDEYRSKKNWQKLIIMLGGIIMNILLAWVIYSQLLFWTGEVKLPAEGVKNGIHCDSIALMAGFRDGDMILSHDGGTKFESWFSVPKELLLDNIKTVEVKRNGQIVTIELPADFITKAVAARGHGLFEYRIPCLVGDLAKENVIKGKLQKGDVIVKINDSTINYFTDAPAVLATLKEKDATITFVRGNDTMHTTVRVPKTGLLGFMNATGQKDLKLYKGYLDFTEVHYGLIESFGAGAVKSYKTIRDYFKQFKLIFSPTVKGYKQLGGVGTIASMYPDDMDLVGFLSLTAFISLVLAVMNLLPIPMLDGGYVIMLLIEMAIRRPLNDRVVENIQKVGFIFILALMVFANGNDLYRWIMTRFFHAG
jgi:regulator of sigma E protease